MKSINLTLRMCFLNNGLHFCSVFEMVHHYYSAIRVKNAENLQFLPFLFTPSIRLFSFCLPLSFCFSLFLQLSLSYLEDSLTNTTSLHSFCGLFVFFQSCFSLHFCTFPAHFFPFPFNWDRREQHLLNVKSLLKPSIKEIPKGFLQ